jgi:hypothetical protein
VAGQAAVEADADADAGGGQGVEAGRGEQRGVRLDGRVHAGAGRDAVADERGEAGQGPGAGQQGLAPVQDQGDVGQGVGARVLGDAVGRAVQDRGRGGGGAVAPGVVRALVQVAVGAGQVAAAVHLHDELAEGEGRAVGHLVTPMPSAVHGRGFPGGRVTANSQPSLLTDLPGINDRN